MSDEQPIVADFGLARHLGTAHSMTVGTPDYMAPEMFRKHDIISPIQCDLYSMGVILYELLTGNRPYNLSCESYDRPPRQPSELREDIDAELNQICLRAVSVSPASRFQTANQFRATLQTWLNSQTPEPEPQLSSGQTTTSENHDFDNDGATEKNLNPLWLKTAAGSTATVLAIAVFVIWFNFFR